MTQRLRAGTVDDFAVKGHLVIKHHRNEICIVTDGDRYYALDNNCSHMGSQIHRGDIEDGAIICPWHRARFLLATGESLDLYASDIATYPVTVEDGTIYIDVEGDE